jgi:ABC-type transport system substrate-binding protein
LVPDLVVEFPSFDNGGLRVNDDGSVTVRYDIQPDAVWSDGVPVSGEDFAFTVEFVMGLGEQLAAAAEDPDSDAEFFMVCGEPQPILTPWETGVYAAVDPSSMSVADKSFEYTIPAEAAAYWPDLFWVVVPKHAVAGTDYLRDWRERMWPSPGPFVVASLDREGHELVLDQNPIYWRTDPETGEALPRLDRIVVTALEDDLLRVTPAEYHDAVRAANDYCPQGRVVEALGADPESEEGAARFTDFQEVLRGCGAVPRRPRGGPRHGRCCREEGPPHCPCVVSPVPTRRTRR